MTGRETPPVRPFTETEADFYRAAEFSHALDLALLGLVEMGEADERDLAALCTLARAAAGATGRLLDDFRALQAVGAFAASFEAARRARG